ncbi:hypothetical protein [Brevibacillus laterosporus]|uniref:hypothetical protein n=1 Tax=Brevibacillus laterosporus TaxID=1465 RepID=UPI0014447AC3|nr:hypothetical protein [Brevibacillus laterosporus]NKQ22469.1 hypothetical protein [Brevibacillus laterosporus]WNX29197.1 hypothetical protein RWW94_13110 [Brevibacillus laterosporus]
MNFRLVTFVLLLSLVSQTVFTPLQAFAASDELSTISKSETQNESTDLNQSSEEGISPDGSTIVLPTESSENSEDIELDEQVSRDTTDSIEKEPENDTSTDNTALEEEAAESAVEEANADDSKKRTKRAVAAVKEEVTVHKGETIVFESDTFVSISSNALSSKNNFYNYIKYDTEGAPVEFIYNAHGQKSIKGKMIATVISDEPVTFKYPPGVKVTFPNTPALRTVELELNESYTFTNTSDFKFYVKAKGETKTPSPKYDFSLYDSDDNLIKSLVAQGSSSQAGGILLKPGEKVVVTTISGDSIRFSAPFDTTTGGHSDTPALIRTELSLDESLTLTNIRNKVINLQTNASSKNPVKYVKYKSNGAPGSINVKHTTNISISPEETIVVSPSTSEPVTFIYHPLQLLHEDESDPPFYEQVLQKGDSYYFDNLSDFPLSLKEIRVSSSDKFDYKIYDDEGNFVKEFVNTSTPPKLSPNARALISNVSDNPITIYSHYRYLSSTDSSEPALERIMLHDGETIEFVNISDKTQKIRTDTSKKNDNLVHIAKYNSDGSIRSDAFSYLWGYVLGTSSKEKSVFRNEKIVFTGISKKPATLIYNKDNFSVRYSNKEALTYKLLHQGESVTFYNNTDYDSLIKSFGKFENTKYSYIRHLKDGGTKEYEGYIINTSLPAHSRVTITLLSEEPFVFYGPGEIITETADVIPTYNTLELNSSQTLDQEDTLYYKFTTRKSGLHRLFTDSIDINSTDIKIYEDPQLTTLITESAENITLGSSHYKKAETLLRGNQTYYVQITGASSSRRITLEEDFDSTSQDATPATLNAIYDFDLSSVFDIDYYRYILTESSQLNIILPKGIATIENGNGDILKTIVAGSDDTVFIPENPGVYFVKQQLSPEEPQYRTKRSIGSGKAKFAVKDLTPTPIFTPIVSVPGSKQPVSFKWKYLSPHSKTIFEVYLKVDGKKKYLVYRNEKNELFEANKRYSFLWDGFINVNQEGFGAYAGNGRYTVSIYAEDAPQYKYEADVIVNNSIATTEINADLLISKYNSTIASSKITEMQKLLSQMSFYEGKATGQYDTETLMAVIAYENVLNKWSRQLAVEVYTKGTGYFSEVGQIDNRLLNYARIDAGLGRDKYGSIYDILYIGDALILTEAASGVATEAIVILSKGSKLIKKVVKIFNKVNDPIDAITKKVVKNLIEKVKIKDPVWKSIKFLEGHVDKRINRGHLPKGSTVKDLNNKVKEIMSNPENEVYEYFLEHFEQKFYVFSDNEWIVIIGEDGVMETTFPPDNGPIKYLNPNKGYKKIGKVKELLK